MGNAHNRDVSHARDPRSHRATINRLARDTGGTRMLGWHTCWDDRARAREDRLMDILIVWLVYALLIVVLFGVAVLRYS